MPFITKTSKFVHEKENFVTLDIRDWFMLNQPAYWSGKFHNALIDDEDYESERELTNFCYKADDKNPFLKNVFSNFNFREGYIFKMYENDRKTLMPLFLPAEYINFTDKPVEMIDNVMEILKFAKQTALDIFATNQNDDKIQKPLIFLIPIINTKGEIVLINAECSIDTESVNGVKMEICSINPRTNGQLPYTVFDELKHQSTKTEEELEFLSFNITHLLKDNTLPQKISDAEGKKIYKFADRNPKPLEDFPNTEKRLHIASWKNLAMVLGYDKEECKEIKSLRKIDFKRKQSIKNSNSVLTKSKMHFAFEIKNIDQTWTPGMMEKLVLLNYDIMSKNKKNSKKMKLYDQKLWVSDKKYRTVDKFGRLVTVEANTFGRGVSKYVRDASGKIMYKKRVTDINNTLLPLTQEERQNEIFDLIYRKAHAKWKLNNFGDEQVDSSGLPKSYYSTIVNNIDAELTNNAGYDIIQKYHIDSVCNSLNIDGVIDDQQKSLKIIQSRLTDSLFTYANNQQEMRAHITWDLSYELTKKLLNSRGNGAYTSKIRDSMFEMTAGLLSHAYDIHGNESMESISTNIGTLWYNYFINKYENNVTIDSSKEKILNSRTFGNFHTLIDRSIGMVKWYHVPNEEEKLKFQTIKETSEKSSDVAFIPKSSCETKQALIEKDIEIISERKE
ncbi:MAG: hypothetical protein LBH55_02760 [Mycoplasmataceae bacterium]|nr:hypothetical protein [Mycoplasmataceae bacterium]